MKVSKDKQRETRLLLIDVAVETITEKGFKSATMREIAKRAGIGSATIYSYFPTKEKLLYAYFEEQYIKLSEQLDEIEGFDEFEFGEKIQTLIETILDNFLKDREFVQEAFHLAVLSPLTSFQESKVARNIFLDICKDIWNKKIEQSGGTEKPVLQDWLLMLFWEYYLGIVAYWLKDDSEGFANTSELIDRTVSIIQHIVESDLSGKLLDLGMFVYRTHFYNYIERLAAKCESKSNIKKDKQKGGKKKDSAKQEAEQADE